MTFFQTQMSRAVQETFRLIFCEARLLADCFRPMQSHFERNEGVALCFWKVSDPANRKTSSM
jgi:hypothetical protein